MTTLISYDGAIVAVASQIRVHFTGPLADADTDDPRRRFVTAMASYARDVITGTLPGPYDQADAELYARSMLIDDAAFERAAGETDEQLATRFGVPLEQIPQKRAELAPSDPS